jgi:hypothetical protein
MFAVIRQIADSVKRFPRDKEAEPPHGNGFGGIPARTGLSGGIFLARKPV